MKTQTGINNPAPYIVTETFGTTHHIKGTMPVVRFGDCIDAVIVSLGAPKEACKSKARLVSAASELLAALTYTNLDTDHDGVFCNCPLADGTRPDKDHATSCETARHAIAKARGES